MPAIDIPPIIISYTELCRVTYQWFDDCCERWIRFSERPPSPPNDPPPPLEQDDLLRNFEQIQGRNKRYHIIDRNGVNTFVEVPRFVWVRRGR